MENKLNGYPHAQNDKLKLSPSEKPRSLEEGGGLLCLWRSGFYVVNKHTLRQVLFSLIVAPKAV